MGLIKDYTKTLYTFFNVFCPAYVQNSVPTGTQEDYLTYSIDIDDFFIDGVIQINIYTNSKFFLNVTDIADRILEDIGRGKVIDINGERKLYLKPNGTPFQMMVDEENTNFKNGYLVLDKQIL